MNTNNNGIIGLTVHFVKKVKRIGKNKTDVITFEGVIIDKINQITSEYTMSRRSPLYADAYLVNAKIIESTDIKKYPPCDKYMIIIAKPENLVKII